MPHEAEHRDTTALETGAALRARLSDAILDSAADSIVACDHDGIIRFWNPGAERLFGYSSAEAFGRSLDLIIPERLRQRHWEGYRRVMVTGETRYGTGDVLSVPAARKDGATISVEFTIYPLRSGARLAGMAAVLRDVTLRFNEMRELKRKLGEVSSKSGSSARHEPVTNPADDMNRMHQIEMARSFLARHRARPVLLLPNAWDALSARLFVAAGFDALATTSGGVAWALGYPDGESVPWPEVVAATARIVRCAQVPVTADIEAGYAATPAEITAHVREIIGTGVVGINLEDGLHGPMRTVEDASARLRAAREAAQQEGVPIVINARCDIFHLQHGEESTRLAATVERCKAYVAAGADCVYPFGLRDASIIAALVKAVDAPVNVTGRAGMPDAAALEKIGVARITVASAPALVAMSGIQKLAAELRATGGFEMLTGTLRHPDAQKLFQPKG